MKKTNLKYMFSKAIRSFERFAAEFTGVGPRMSAISRFQFVIVLFHGADGVRVVVVIHSNDGVSSAPYCGFGLVPSPV